MRNTWKHSLSLRLLRFINRTTDVQLFSLKYQNLNIDTCNTQEESRGYRMSRSFGHLQWWIISSLALKKEVCLPQVKQTHRIRRVRRDRSVGYNKYCSKASIDKYVLGKRMQLMVHINMALQVSERAAPEVGVSLLCCRGIVHLHCY